MPPFRLSGVCTGISSPALEARRANVLGSQLQVTQRAHKAAAPLAASLERLVGMKETGRLVRKGNRGGGVRTRNRPDGNLQTSCAVRAGLPSILCLGWRHLAFTTGAGRCPRFHRRRIPSNTRRGIYIAGVA
jgi:hypothetical protein